MKRAITLLAGVLAFAVATGYARTTTASRANCCELVQEALLTSMSIEPGMTRREVEAEFLEDGGLQAPSKTRYIYRGCRFIKVDVWYRVKSDAQFDPSDLVTKISRPYLEHPDID